MKYTGRISAVLIILVTGAAFKIYDYISLGYIPFMEWILNGIFVIPGWWAGLQYDKAKFYSRELELRDKELNSLFDSVDAVIYSFDYSSEKLMISSRVSDLYGYSADEFKENIQLWKKVVYLDDINKAIKFEREIKEGRDTIIEFRIKRPNGESRWIQKRVTPIFDSSGNIIKVNGIDIDIDPRKKMEELLDHSQKQNRELLEKRLEESEQRFKSLFVHNPDAIFTINLDGKIIEANQAVEELIGYTIEEIKEKELEAFILPENIELHREHLKYVSEGKRQEFTLSMTHKDGRKIVVSLKVIPIITDNQFIGLYEIAKDITETKLTEEMIRRSEKLSVVGQLAAGVAHEIRNPLTALKGFVQLFKSDINNQYSEIMLSELDRIDMIVSELLILSKPQITKYEYKDIKEILESIIFLLEPQTSKKNIQFRFEIDELPLIRCEQNQLKQVFINLLKNAMEAMPDGGDIVVLAKMKNEEMTSIQIIDEGIGIDGNHIPKLGDPFFSTKEDGTGLGLMVSFGIIENHGGTMEITSQLNKGTTIEICLPIHCPSECH